MSFQYRHDPVPQSTPSLAPFTINDSLYLLRAGAVAVDIGKSLGYIRLTY